MFFRTYAKSAPLVEAATRWIPSIRKSTKLLLSSQIHCILFVMIGTHLTLTIGIFQHYVLEYFQEKNIQTVIWQR